MNGGVYFFKKKLLNSIKNKNLSLEEDVLQNLPPGTLGAHAGEIPFLDIGTPEDLDRAPGIFEPFDQYIIIIILNG